MTEAHLVSYNGSPAFAHLLVEYLEAEGVLVSWAPPAETRGGLGEVIASVVISITANAPVTAVLAGVRRFQAENPGKGDIQVDWPALDGD
jgi:hypothetical protein